MSICSRPEPPTQRRP